MQTKKLISYLTCEKFQNDIFQKIEERYKCTIIKDAIIVNIKNEVVIPFKYDVVGGRDNYWKGYNSKGVWYYLVQKKWDGKEEYINKKGEIFKRREDVKD